MKTRVLTSIFISVVATVALSACGGSSTGSQASAQGLPVAEVQWQQGGVPVSEQIPLQQVTPKDWQGTAVLQLPGAVPDSLTISAPIAQIDPLDGPNGLSGGPDHDRGRPDKQDDHGQHDAKQAPSIRLNGPRIGANGGQSLGQISGAMDMDASGNVIIHAQGLRNLAHAHAGAPICGSNFMLEIDLEHAKVSLPVAIGC